MRKQSYNLHLYLHKNLPRSNRVGRNVCRHLELFFFLTTRADFKISGTDEEEEDKSSYEIKKKENTYIIHAIKDNRLTVYRQYKLI